MKIGINQKPTIIETESKGWLRRRRCALRWTWHVRVRHPTFGIIHRHAVDMSLSNRYNNRSIRIGHTGYIATGDQGVETRDQSTTTNNKHNKHKIFFFKKKKKKVTNRLLMKNPNKQT